jgi:hypothetical protein
MRVEEKYTAEEYTARMTEVALAVAHEMDDKNVWDWRESEFHGMWVATLWAFEDSDWRDEVLGNLSLLKQICWELREMASN